MDLQVGMLRDISRQSINTPLLILIINKLYRHDIKETGRKNKYFKNVLYYKSQIKIQICLKARHDRIIYSKCLNKAHYVP